MGIFDGILGLEEVKTRLNNLESRVESMEAFLEPDIHRLEESEQEVFQALEKQMTTEEVASKLGKSRSLASLILNRLEKKGRVKEAGWRGRELLYESVENH